MEMRRPRHAAAAGTAQRQRSRRSSNADEGVKRREGPAIRRATLLPDFHLVVMQVGFPADGGGHIHRERVAVHDSTSIHQFSPGPLGIKWGAGVGHFASWLQYHTTCSL